MGQRVYRNRVVVWRIPKTPLLHQDNVYYGVAASSQIPPYARTFAPCAFRAGAGVPTNPTRARLLCFSRRKLIQRC